MKTLLLHFFILVSFTAYAQVIDLENFHSDVDQVYDGANDNGLIDIGSNVLLENVYSQAYGYIGGFAISSMTDSLTPGFLNQFSSASGNGAESTLNYAIAYAFSPVKIFLNNGQGSQMVEGMYINNNTFAYYSMLNGDNYAKKFGGLDGNDPDFFLLTVGAYKDGIYLDHEEEFYLADFRSDDPIEDYILKEWTWLELSDFGAIDSLEFRVTSSDIGNYGLNTPAYFCWDQMELGILENSNDIAVTNVSVYPNPFLDFVNIGADEQIEEITLYNGLGQVVTTVYPKSQDFTMKIDDSSTALFYLNIKTVHSNITKKIARLK